jgi:hypothetical protein
MSEFTMWLTVDTGETDQISKYALHYTEHDANSYVEDNEGDFEVVEVPVL